MVLSRLKSNNAISSQKDVFPASLRQSNNCWKSKMKIMQWLTFIIIVCLLIIRGFWPDSFTFDRYSALLLFLLAIPLLAPFLKKAKWFGAEFDFKESIQNLSVLVEKSKASSEKNKKNEPNSKLFFATFSADTAIQLVEQDPNLALASLRIEIEKTLRVAYKTLVDQNDSGKKGIGFLINALFDFGAIEEHQRNALYEINKLCNEAVHGGTISVTDALEIIDLSIRLSVSFGTGYSINFQPNRDYEAQGLSCEWEHCIEHFPLREEPDDRTCPIWGHDCPGGIGTRMECKKSINDIPDERFRGI
jgi:hypothetical protein